MFVCQPCHAKSACKNGFVEALLTSRGSCEVCGTTASCLDCHGYKVSSPEPAPVSEYPLTPRQIVEGGMATVGYREMLDVARKLGIEGYEGMTTEQMKIACKCFVAENPEPGQVLRQVMDPEDAAMWERALSRADRDQIIVIGELHGKSADLRRKVSRLEAQITAMQDAHIETIRLLRLAAEGRREYAATGSEAQHVMTDTQILRAEAQNFDSARKIVEGDTSPLYGLLPSWRWGEAGLS